MAVPERADTPRITAAGVVALRGSGKRTEALVVHRPDRNDWSLPKGKLDPGERIAACAVRETLEETGIGVTLGVPLPSVRYRVNGTRGSGSATAKKTVHYWRGIVQDPSIASGDVDVPAHWAANHEIGDVRWVRLSALPGLLTYPHDLDIVQAATAAPEHTSPFIVVRHAQAEKRGAFRARVGDEISDNARPLTPHGVAQAQALISALAAYGIRSVASSSAERCMATVMPYAESVGVDVAAFDALTELAFAEHPKRGAREVIAQLRQASPSVVCIHRPTKKRLMREIAEETDQFVNLALQPAEYIVFHRAAKRGPDGEFRSVRLGDSTVIEYGLHDA